MKCIALLTVMLITVGTAGPVAAFEWEYVGMDGIMTTCIEVDPQHNRVFVGTIEGFHYYMPHLDVWTERDWEGWIGRHVHSIDWHPGLNGRVLTGRQNAFFKGYIELSEDLGETEEIVYNSDGGGVTDLHHDGGYYYACTWPDVAPGEFLRSEDGGASWTLLTGHGHFAMTALETDQQGVLYLAGDNRVTRSWDNGTSWEPIGGDLPAGLVRCMAAGFGGGDVLPEISLFAGNDLGLYHSYLPGEWTEMLAVACRNIESIPVIAPWPANADELVAVTADGRVLYSRSFGGGWDDETGNLPGVPVDIAYSFSDRGLYVCTEESGVWRATGVVTAVPDPPDRPLQASLRAWPNPFNPRAQLVFTLGASGPASLAIFDLTGRKVTELARSWFVAGEHTLSWQPDDLASGVYLARLDGIFGVRTTRLVLLK